MPLKVSSILHVDRDYGGREPWPIVIEGVDGVTTEGRRNKNRGHGESGFKREQQERGGSRARTPGPQVLIPPAGTTPTLTGHPYERQVDLKPGQLLLYESAKCTHGRPVSKTENGPRPNPGPGPLPKERFFFF